MLDQRRNALERPRRTPLDPVSRRRRCHSLDLDDLVERRVLLFLGRIDGDRDRKAGSPDNERALGLVQEERFMPSLIHGPASSSVGAGSAEANPAYSPSPLSFLLPEMASRLPFAVDSQSSAAVTA